MLIPNNVIISFNPELAKRKTSKLIIKRIWVSDKDYRKYVIRLMSNMTLRRDEKGAFCGSVY